jgi:hypothetical protein
MRDRFWTTQQDLFQKSSVCWQTQAQIPVSQKKELIIVNVFKVQSVLSELAQRLLRRAGGFAKG